MKIEYARIILTVLSYIFLICSGYLCFQIVYHYVGKLDGAGEKAKERADKLFKERGTFTRAKLKLSKMGIMYRMHDYNMTPAMYLMMRLAVGAILTIIIYMLLSQFVISLLGFPIGYYLVEIYFKKKNESDNKDIITDLYKTYVNLKMQLESGLYIADALEYTHKTVRNERYKQALGELVINISDKTISMTEAVERFKNRFSSREIDKLCSLIESFVLYGNQASYTKDIMAEIKSIVLAQTIETEKYIEDKTGLVNFGFFGILVCLVMYALMTNLTGIQSIF